VVPWRRNDRRRALYSTEDNVPVGAIGNEEEEEDGTNDVVTRGLLLLLLLLPCTPEVGAMAMMMILMNNKRICTNCKMGTLPRFVLPTKIGVVISIVIYDLLSVDRYTDLTVDGV